GDEGPQCLDVLRVETPPGPADVRPRDAGAHPRSPRAPDHRHDPHAGGGPVPARRGAATDDPLELEAERLTGAGAALDGAGEGSLPVREPTAGGGLAGRDDRGDGVLAV